VTTTVTPPKRRAMEFNALALMASTVLTGLLGVVFWVAAARLLPPAEVGRASSALSAITFLAGLAQLNIISVLLRFVPGAGRATGGFIARAYGLALGTGLVVTLVFLALGLGSDILGDEWFVPLVFLGAVLCYAVFLVQDGALTALGAAVWVPLENLLAGALRVGLVFALAVVSTQWGALAALVAPTVVAIAVVNWFVFRRLVPRHVATTTATTDVGWRTIRGFVAGDYVASALASCVALLPPVLVSAELGSEAAAYFYIPWFIGVQFGTLVWNIAMAFVVEYAADSGTISRLVRRSVRLTAAVSLAACVDRAVLPVQRRLRALHRPERLPQEAGAAHLVAGRQDRGLPDRHGAGAALLRHRRAGRALPRLRGRDRPRRRARRPALLPGARLRRRGPPPGVRRTRPAPRR
jgi:O-antigen/teichoic acid export membrane protein